MIGVADVDFELDVVDEDAVCDGDVEHVAPSGIHGVLEVGHRDDARRGIDLRGRERWK